MIVFALKLILGFVSERSKFPGPLLDSINSTQVKMVYHLFVLNENTKGKRCKCFTPKVTDLDITKDLIINDKNYL